ncbi:hypothetical protein KIW84_056541 [Lathyrus oleraceus]|uniref:Kinesin motor domain-containing protein n=1 Tax=Pisum sativum TaxID=3888 RepID=A0A9D4X0U0_PEA|nr:hypothetical protein KIW84_056541 [Pisum sativum]
MFYNLVLILGFKSKGNIRVFRRCRPLNKVEIFDRVYTPKDDQVDVFADASSMVISVLDGYNVCIFAYGQTGTDADGSSGSVTPLRVNPVSDPFVADALLALPEPLREALYSSFSKAASSNPVLANIADSISKIGQSILKPQGNSHTAKRRLKFRHLTLPEIPHYNHCIVLS